MLDTWRHADKENKQKKISTENKSKNMRVSLQKKSENNALLDTFVKHLHLVKEEMQQGLSTSF